MVDDGYFAVVLNTNPYTYLGTRPFDLAPEATLDRGLADGDGPHAAGRCPFLGLVGSARCAAATRIRPARHVDYRADLDARRGRRATARSPTRSTATTSARSTQLELPPRARTCIRLVLP